MDSVKTKWHLMASWTNALLLSVAACRGLANQRARMGSNLHVLQIGHTLVMACARRQTITKCQGVRCCVRSVDGQQR